MREYRKNLFDAWLQAYETTMFHICSFLWLAKRHLSKEVTRKDDPGIEKMPRDRSGILNRGAVYNEVMQWCKDNDYKFPFYEKMVLLRNNRAHVSYLIDDSNGELKFLDEKKKPIGHSLPLIEAQRAAEHDIAMADQYFQGIPLALLGRKNLLGHFDALWRLYKRQVPDIRSVLDLEIDGSDPFGGPAATRDEVIDYLSKLSSLDFLHLIDEVKTVWDEAI